MSGLRFVVTRLEKACAGQCAVVVHPGVKKPRVWAGAFFERARPCCQRSFPGGDHIFWWLPGAGAESEIKKRVEHDRTHSASPPSMLLSEELK